MEDKEIMELLQQNQNLIERLQKRNAGLRAQNETWVRVSESNDKVEMAAVAKILNYNRLGRNKLFEVLRDEGILRYNNEPYQKFIDAGYFGIIEQEVSTSFGNTIVNKKTVVTQKGIDYIRKIVDKLGYGDTDADTSR